MSVLPKWILTAGALHGDWAFATAAHGCCTQPTVTHITRTQDSKDRC